MNHFSRLGTLTLMITAGALVLLHPSVSSAQFVTVLQESQPYLLHGGSQGYLGVTLHDVDNDRAVALKLKDAKGAEIVTVDHDAPAGKAGLQTQDVILQLNGQAIEGADQLRRLLREIPAGRTVTLVIGRDGQQLNVMTKLVDRKVLDQEAWGQHVDPPPPQQGTVPALGFDRGAAGGLGSGDSWSLGSGEFSVGAVVDPLGAQLASYFGVVEGVGLLIKSVDRKSPAKAAGLKAGDVVLKVNDDTMATRADWQRVLRANQGKQVLVTVIRDKKPQQLTMQAGNLKKKGALELKQLCDCDPNHEMLAELRDLPALNNFQESIGGIDPAEIAAQARAAVKDIDADSLREQLREAQEEAKKIDVDAVRAEIEQATKNFDEGAVREQLRQAQDAVKNIDVDALRAEVQRSVKNLDEGALREQLKQAQDAAKKIDVDAIRAQVDQSAKQIEQMKKQLDDLQRQLQQPLRQPAH